ARIRMEKLRDLAERVMENLRQLTTRLRPTVLDELGLVPALITHTDDCATRFPFTVDVEVTGERQRLPSEMETALYRIAQEALTNVAKHALANHVHVRLHFGDQEMTLGVSDDGVGMDVQDARQAAALGEGWGLAGIYERTDLMNGRIDIQSAPGAGTRLTVQVPIPHTSPSCEGEEL
ncbi:MAG: sensor histidine kinase, partial [Anaerolineae bacterium]